MTKRHRLRHLGASLLLAAAVPLAWAQDNGALFRAVKQDNESAVRNLLASGADPNAKDEKGMPALYVALQEGALKAARQLIASPRLQPETRNGADESPLMMAALKGQLDIARQLIAKGADVNKPGWAPLHYAATGGHLDIMRQLLEAHAFIDAESPNGTTPLMMAARGGHITTCKVLLDGGADVRLKNQLGMTAVDFAMQSNQKEIADGLRKRLEQVNASRPAGK